MSRSKKYEANKLSKYVKYEGADSSYDLLDHIFTYVGIDTAPNDSHEGILRTIWFCYTSDVARGSSFRCDGCHQLINEGLSKKTITPQEVKDVYRDAVKCHKLAKEGDKRWNTK